MSGTRGRLAAGHRTGRVALVALVALALAGLAAGCGSQNPGTQRGVGPSGTTPPARSSVPSATPSWSAAGCAGAGASGPLATAYTGVGGRHQLTAVQFVSAQTGWVTGRDRILKTVDGGQHWLVQYRTSPGVLLSGVDFVDASHGWVTGPGVLLTTADGGAHWQHLPVPCQPLRSVHFISPLTGFAVAGASHASAASLAQGGIVLKTSDGGRTWSRLRAPVNAQSVCFSSPGHGWLGANGSVYGTADGGASWSLAVRDPYLTQGPAFTSVATVQCAGPTAAWAVILGPGAAMSHQPYVGLHTYGVSWSPVFSELYMAAPGIHTKTEAPGPYSGPFSAVSPDQAVFVGYCGPCSPPAPGQAGEAQGGTAPMGLATNGGTKFALRGGITGLSVASAAAFVSPTDGWVVGELDLYPMSGKGSAPAPLFRILHTTDGGLSWQVQYSRH